MTTAPEDDLLLPLGRTGWRLWADAGLRGAGFPVHRFSDLCDDELAAAADQIDDPGAPLPRQFHKVAEEAERRLTATVRAAAADPPFREAITWQNPALVTNCLDKLVAGERRNTRGRGHEMTVVSYIQRYCLKNDTVGFFGPMGWAHLTADRPDATAVPGLTVIPGPRLLARRKTYFESWAVDAVADRIADRPEVWPWLRPRTDSGVLLTGWVVRMLHGHPQTLSEAEARVLPRCDGQRTVAEITGAPPDPATLAALLRLRERGVLRMELSGPVVVHPEQALAERIDAIGDSQVRDSAHRTLAELVAARDRVAQACGDAAAVLQATEELGETFRRLTGGAPVRRSGATYAGRTLVYEDCIRDVEVTVGPRLLDRLAPPLGIVLDSAAWLAGAVGDAYAARAMELFTTETARTGGCSVSLVQLITALFPDSDRLATGLVTADIVATARQELQRRWAHVLNLAPPTEEELSGRTAYRRQALSAAIAGPAADMFATGPARWSAARHHSPDVMLDARDGVALDTGEVRFVLGELHCAANTLESQLFPAQHPQPQRLRAMAEATGLDGRVVVVSRRDWPGSTTRMSRSDDLMLPSYAYLVVGDEEIAPPAGAVVLRASEMLVTRRGDRLVVRGRGGRERPLLELLGELLSSVTVNAFTPIAGARRPRVTIDDLVICRESWRFPATDVEWATIKDENRRYVAARRWRATQGLPERCFLRVPVERKPVAVDFRSLGLVNLMAKLVRRTRDDGSEESGDGAAVTVTEMLPDSDGLWLRDAAGERYTAELRVVAVAPR